jgi:hypothetical protein
MLDSKVGFDHDIQGIFRGIIVKTVCVARNRLSLAIGSSLTSPLIKYQ